jgi:hypothetical protein
MEGWHRVPEPSPGGCDEPLISLRRTPREHLMAAKLDKLIKRELELDGKLYTVSISPEGVKITPKGARKGPELTWRTLLSGDAELSRDLNISVDAYKPE